MIHDNPPAGLRPFTWLWEITRALELPGGDSASLLLEEPSNDLFFSITAWLRAEFKSFSTEIRLSYVPGQTAVQLYFVVRVSEDPLLIDAAYLNYCGACMEGLLPAYYQYARISDAARIKSVLFPEAQGQVYELRRKPSVLRLGNLLKQHLAAPHLTPITGNANPDSVSADKIFSIPAVREFSCQRRNWSALFRRIYSSPDAVHLRMALTAVILTPDDQLHAAHYRRQFLESGESLPTRTASDTDLIRGLEKFRENDWLYGMNMQVMAEGAGSALSVAQLLSAIGMGSAANRHFEINRLHEREVDVRNLWSACEFYFSRYPDICKRSSYDEAFLMRSGYLYTDSEAAGLFALPHSDAKNALAGFEARAGIPFYDPSVILSRNEAASEGKEHLVFGKIVTSFYPAKAPPFKMLLKSLSKHALVVGTTGAGKSTTMGGLLEGLIGHSTHFMIIEPVKAEYYDRLIAAFKAKYGSSKKLHRFNFKKPFLRDKHGKLIANPEFLRFNPFIPYRDKKTGKGITTDTHLGYIQSCIMAAFPLYNSMPDILSQALRAFYEAEELYPGKVREWKNKDGKFQRPAEGAVRVSKPLGRLDFFDESKSLSYSENGDIEMEHTMTAFANFITEYVLTRSWDPKFKGEMESALSRRIQKLTQGLVAEIICPELWSADESRATPDIPDLIDLIVNGEESCIIELEDVPDPAEKSLIMAFIMTFLYEARSLRQSHGTDPLHVTIVEEAHRLLSNGNRGTPGSGGEQANLSQNSQSKVISLFVDMLAEVRAKNEGIIVVEQHPTKLVPEIVKSANLVIMHQLRDQEDRDYLGRAMNMSEEEMHYVNSLETGEAAVFEGQLTRPILVKMNNHQINKPHGQ